jgi:hypothetical protein
MNGQKPSDIVAILVRGTTESSKLPLRFDAATIPSSVPP